MRDKIELLGLYPAELAEFVADLGEKHYRGGQIFTALMEGRRFHEMTTISKALREKLSEVALDNAVTLVEEIASTKDDTRKMLFSMADGNVVEGVLMRHHHGDTLCLSTQVGCAMGCAFCASTIDGCVRNLTAGEMMGQLLISRDVLGGRISNVVLMGSGEPLLNYDNVVRFIRLATDARGLNLSVRGISLSTCGLADKIVAFSEEGLPVTLCISLHGPSDDVRKRIMPIAETISMDEILASCRRYIEKTGRRVIFEYALIDGLNCELHHADELASRLRHMQCHVNLIPLNPVPERDLKAPPPMVVEAFVKRLQQRNISATLRRELGNDIAGACGQLRRSRRNRQEGDNE